MTEVLKWGENEFKIGDKLISLLNHRFIVISDIHSAADEYIRDVVILTMNGAYPIMMDAEEFAYRVDQGHFTRLVEPVYQVGRMFTHHANNDTIEILSISERQDTEGEYQYFVGLVNEIGERRFTHVAESYLVRCRAFELPMNTELVLPEIEADAVFPGTLLV